MGVNPITKGTLLQVITLPTGKGGSLMPIYLIALLGPQETLLLHLSGDKAS